MVLTWCADSFRGQKNRHLEVSKREEVLGTNMSLCCGLSSDHAGWV